jgi:hypothetical protein
MSALAGDVDTMKIGDLLNRGPSGRRDHRAAFMNSRRQMMSQTRSRSRNHSNEEFGQMKRTGSKIFGLATMCAALAFHAVSYPALAQAVTSSVVEDKLANIRIRAGDIMITAELADNATSRDFLARLPMTVTMTRSGEREYHGRPDTPISVDGPKQGRFDNGDLGYWAPGGYLAIFLDNTVKPEITDLIVMGKVTSDLASIKRLGPLVDISIERAGP